MNILVVGYGGQGVITLAHVIGRAAFKEGFDVKQAELHGLSQRMGSLQCHVRIGKKVFSPMSRKGDVDVVIALELTEALRAEPYVNKEKTKLLVNRKILKDNPFGEDLDEKELEEKLREIYKEVEIVDAEQKIREIGGDMQNTVRNYRVLFRKEPESGYTVIVPVLPGCVTYGDTIDNAVAMAEEAIELYIESLEAHGEDIPTEQNTFEYMLAVGANA